MKYILGFAYLTFCVVFIFCVYCVVMGVGSFPSAIVIGIIMLILIIFGWEDIEKIIKCEG